MAAQISPPNFTDGRIHMLLLTKDEIKSVFTMNDAIEADKKCYELFSAGKTEVPLRTNIPTSKGSFLFMPAYAEEMRMAGMKIVNIFPGNPEQGLETTQSQVLIMDGDTGVVTALMDGGYVTALRTAAASGAAFDLYGLKNASVGALIGTGSQAECQLEALLCTRDVKEVRVSARNFEKTKKFVEKEQKNLGDRYGAKLIACRNGDEAVRGADLITTVTVSEEPLFKAGNVKPGAVISAVGAYMPNMQEIDPELFKLAGKIYFDSTEAVLAESGDVIKPLNDGVFAEDIFTGEIGEQIAGKISGRESDDEIIIFENVGIGALDLAAGAEIYNKAKAADAGTRWGE